MEGSRIRNGSGILNRSGSNTRALTLALAALTYIGDLWMHQLLRILLVQIINYHTGEFLILHFFNVALRSLWVFFLLTLAAALIGFFIFAIKIL